MKTKETHRMEMVEKKEEMIIKILHVPFMKFIGDKTYAFFKSQDGSKNEL